jgi:hypothetical protein
MNRLPAHSSPQVYARAAGALYLLVIVLGGFAYGYVPGKLLTEDAATTAHNILAHETLWRIGIMAALVVVVCALAQLLFEYLLLRPVEPRVMLLAVIFNLLSLVIEALASLGHLAALHVLKGHFLAGFSLAQLQSAAVLAIGLHDATLNIAFLFFGFTCLLYGYLILRSRFLPKFLGVLMGLAGLCYIANASLDFLNILPPGFPWLLLPAGVSELSLCLWLLVVGVNVTRWREWA